MDKVLVERSRTGGRNDRKGRPARDIEDLPKKESMKRSHTDHKSLNENLRPLERYLLSSVGKHWDNVYSDISANLKSSSAVQQHVRDHVWDYVAKNVFYEGRSIYQLGRYYGKVSELRNGQMYICPKTGLLKKYKVKKAKKVPFDFLTRDLQTLTSSKCKLVIEAEGVFRLYVDPLTKEWTIKQKATARHAQLDFSTHHWRFAEGSVKHFFATYGKKINLKHPYFKTYLELINEAQLVKKSKEKPSKFQVGAAVEISADGGKSWLEGVINRMDGNRHFWVTVGDKNININPFIPRHQIRIKKV